MMRCLAQGGFPDGACNLAPANPIRLSEFAETLANELSLPTRRQPLASLRHSLDGAVAAAFATSIRLRSRHTRLFRDAEVRYPDAVSALRDVVAGHKARIPRKATEELH